jgi:hypothetical protein
MSTLPKPNTKETPSNWIYDMKDKDWKQLLRNIQTVGLHGDTLTRIESVALLQWASESIQQNLTAREWLERVRYMRLPMHLHTSLMKYIRPETIEMVEPEPLSLSYGGVASLMDAAGRAISKSTQGTPIPTQRTLYVV